MRVVFKEYGLTIITCIVCILCLCAIWRILHFEYQYVAKLNGLDEAPAKAFEVYQYGGNMNMKKEERTISVGEKVAVSEYFKVWDDKGNAGSVEVVSAVGLEGVDCYHDIVLENGTQYFCFSAPGVYTLSLDVAIPNHSKQTIDVSIPVQQALG